MATINVTNNSSSPFTVSSGNLTITSGNAVITSGNLNLPATSSTVGQIVVNGTNFFHTYGTGNTFLGNNSGNFTLTSSGCACVGTSAGTALTNGDYNTFIGYQSGSHVTSGSQNVCVGYQAGLNLITGSTNVLLGYGCGTNYTSSESSNILISNSGTIGESNVIRIGTQGSGQGQTQDCYIAGIYSPATALGSTQNAVMIDSTGKLGGLAGGVGTILIGGTAPSFLTAGTTGQTLMAVTSSSPIWTGSPSFSGSITAGTGVTITSGNLNLPTTSSTVGQITINSLRFLHAYGTNNTFIGKSSANFTLTGTNSTATGYNTLNALSSGNNNSAYGSGSLALCTSGSNNSAYGASSLAAVTTSGDNTAVGYQSLAQATGCANCTAIGYQSGYNYTTTESSNISIGSGVTGTTSESNVLRIGAGTGTGTNQINAAYISGIQGITVTGAAVFVSTSDQLGVIASSIRFKENIRDMGNDSNNLDKLRPVTFNYKSDEDKSIQYGLIAEEVAEIYPELTHYDKDGKPFSVAYHVLPAMLLNEIQKLNKRITELETELEK